MFLPEKQPITPQGEFVISFNSQRREAEKALEALVESQPGGPYQPIPGVSYELINDNWCAVRHFKPVRNLHQELVVAWSGGRAFVVKEQLDVTQVLNPYKNAPELTREIPKEEQLAMSKQQLEKIKQKTPSEETTQKPVPKNSATTTYKDMQRLAQNKLLEKKSEWHYNGYNLPGMLLIPFTSETGEKFELPIWEYLRRVLTGR